MDREGLRGRASLRVVQSDAFECLTTREHDVLRLLATGAINAEIARQLGLSEGTVRNLIARLTCKLGVADRTQAALLGYRAGFEWKSAITLLDAGSAPGRVQWPSPPLAFDR